MYSVILNRNNIVIDYLETQFLRYIKLQPETGLVIACSKEQGTGIIGSNADTHYILMNADLQQNENAVKVMEFDTLPEDFAPNYYILNTETNELKPRYQTPAEKRENAYETNAIISWFGDEITVDEGNKLWQAYTAEGKVDIAQELTSLISEAKQEIRNEFPDESVETE